MQPTKKKGKKGRKIGRNLRKPAKKRYKAGYRRFSNKLKRIQQSEGDAAAAAYAAKRPCHAKRYRER